MNAPASAHQPLVVELFDAPSPAVALRRFASQPGCLLLDSALRDPKLGRYSFLTADPFEWITATGSEDGLAKLRRVLAPFSVARLPELPPFQGGAAGLLSYDLVQSLERLPTLKQNDFDVPTMAVGLYDTVIAWDHVDERTWIISHGFSCDQKAASSSVAALRLEQFRSRLFNTSSGSDEPRPDSPTSDRPTIANQWSAPQVEGLLSNFTPENYLRAAQRAIDYILAGDVFQVNLAQRLLYPATGSAIDLYDRLRQRNAAPFAGYFDLGEFQILSASPERFVQVCEGRVEARPIKGTRKRTFRAEADLFAGDDLLASEKDRAENTMIVDLLRNDLSQACEADSVYVSQLCGLEIYQFVQHLVSVVEGKLAPDQTPIDLIRHAFPGGSITGAPKVRAMEIIAELEPHPRGAYCGSLGYVGFDGAMDLSILIRTITAGKGWWQFPVGGGIVAQSVPELEYAETWHKAAGILSSLRP